MKCIIIGLGNYGQVLAEELSALGHEVIGVDDSPVRVELVKEKVATAFVMDATDEQSLAVLPLQTVDLVVVTIGENFGASVRVVALLKRQKVKHIYARAIDPVHRSIMEAFDLDRILSPEADAAREMVHLLEYGTAVETFHVDREYSVVKFTVPQRLVGYSVPDLHLGEEFGLKVIALKRARRVKNFLGIEFTDPAVLNQLPDEGEPLQIEADDELVIYGRFRDFQRFWKAL